MSPPKPDRDLGGARRPGPSGPRLSGSLVVLFLLALAAIAMGIWLWLWLAADDDSAGPGIGVTVDDAAEDRSTDSLAGEPVTMSVKDSCCPTGPPGSATAASGGQRPDRHRRAGRGHRGRDIVQGTGTVDDFDDVPLVEVVDPDETPRGLGPL